MSETGRRFSDIQHGEFGFSRVHDWIDYQGRFACQRCGKIVDDWSMVPDNCEPHDAPALQTRANIGYSDMKRRR